MAQEGRFAVSTAAMAPQKELEATQDFQAMDFSWRQRCEREVQTWKSPAAALAAAAGKDMPSTPCLRPGELVTVTGMRRRPELNGARGEIIGGNIDECGRIAVRLRDAGGTDKTMRIHPFRLQAAGSLGSVLSASAPELATTPSLALASAANARSTARGSGLGGSRPLGSALGAAARGTLLGSSPQKKHEAATSLASHALARY